MTFTQQDDLQEHRALVTGATSGIGRAIAVQFGRMGAEVLVHGRDATRGSQVAEEIERAGGRARFVAADLVETLEAFRRVNFSAADFTSSSLAASIYILCASAMSSILSATTTGTLRADRTESSRGYRLARGAPDEPRLRSSCGIITERGVFRPDELSAQFQS
jgi:NAD(P)-dependent dehydrogenase (short-subunit alcohol dehydrogenase family)